MRQAGLTDPFVQDNVSVSQANVIRGLHLQHPKGQGKLISVVAGSIWDVIVDVRIGSPTFSKWVSVELSEGDGQLVYIPPGLAHGFAVLAPLAAVTYKCTSYYVPENEVTIRWDDAQLGIAWPVYNPTVSQKDGNAPSLADIPRDRLPRYAEPS